MSENNTLARAITASDIIAALAVVCEHAGDMVEPPEPPCDRPRLCTPDACGFPRYHRGGRASGLTGHVLRELGYPIDVLKDLDNEYEVGEVLHPGVKIYRSRNAALRRIEQPGMALLTFLQDHQKDGLCWSQISAQALRRRWPLKRLDARRRPWLY